jgi:DNA-directed RNA polymerase subunit RPC12/RpoP
MPYTHDHENEVTYFAKTNFRNQMVKFGIKTDDRRRHIYVIGKTGMGKTVLLENLFLSDIYAGHGCCYVDPHGDTAEKLIDFIPSWRLNDVVYFNPADLDFPVGFNILEAVSERHKHLIASGMMAVFQKIWENMWSSRMEYILNNTILALLDNPGQTLLGINRLLSDADFRKRIIGNVKDPVVKQFWLVEFASYNDKYAQEAVAPIQNKIGQFLSASVIRNIVAQVKSTINIREIMDEQKILIINLSKGRIGEDNMRLLGGLLITKIQLAAMERVDIPEIDRKDFYLFVDEFQNFAVESFESILSEARKYRLCLTMAHQYITQLSEEVRDAVFGNVGSIITFRVGSPDGLFMETEFAPRFLPEDIINLPKYNVYIKLLIDGVTSQPFSAMTLPPIAQVTHSQEKVIKISRERYAMPRSEIEQKVLQWSGMEDTDMDTLLKEAEEKKKAMKDSKKPKFEYQCTRCGVPVILPVELDRSRPIYCDDCIKIVREEKKTGRKIPVNREQVAGVEKKIVLPPKPSEGGPVEKETVTQSITLDSLSPVRRPSPPNPSTHPTLAHAPVVSQRSYTCSQCSTTFSTDIKLDSSRPLYCESCLKKIREARKTTIVPPVPASPPKPPNPPSPPDPSKPQVSSPRKDSRSVFSAPTAVAKITSQTAPVQNSDNDAEKKRKRKRHKKKPEGVNNQAAHSPSVALPTPATQSVPSSPKPPAGSLRSGQTIRFD